MIWILGVDPAQNMARSWSGPSFNVQPCRAGFDTRSSPAPERMTLIWIPSSDPLASTKGNWELTPTSYVTARPFHDCLQTRFASKYCADTLPMAFLGYRSHSK